jgi:hypothetical protein
MVSYWISSRRRDFFCSRSEVRFASGDVENIVRVIAHRYSILPALSPDGILHLDVRDYSFTSATFNQFIDTLLDNMNPFPQKNSVVVMDNASIHKSVHIAEMNGGRWH